MTPQVALTDDVPQYAGRHRPAGPDGSLFHPRPEDWVWALTVWPWIILASSAVGIGIGSIWRGFM